MSYSKQYNKFYEYYNLVMELASHGYIKDIESLKRAIKYVYDKVSESFNDLMPQDVNGDDEMQCHTLQKSYDNFDGAFQDFVTDYHERQVRMVEFFQQEFGDQLDELNLMRKEMVGLESHADEDGNVSDSDRLKVYVSVIMSALLGDGDNADFCIKLFKYAERLERELPNNGSAKSITKLLDAVRNVMSKDENIRKTLKEIVDTDD